MDLTSFCSTYRPLLLSLSVLKLFPDMVPYGLLRVKGGNTHSSTFRGLSWDATSFTTALFNSLRKPLSGLLSQIQLIRV